MSDSVRREKRPKVGPALLINFATCLAVIGLVWHFSETIKPATKTPDVTTTGPDVTLRFVWAEAPSLQAINISDKVAREIKWSVVLWNLDDPRVYSNPDAPDIADKHEPLPIPVSTIDFVRSYSSGGPISYFLHRLSFPL
jgi:hypothetical protein